VTGGELRGPKFNGSFLPSGGDWLTLRTDGVAVLDIRATLQADDGAVIYMYAKGVGDCGPDGYKAFVDRAPSPKDGIPLKINPWFQTSSPIYE